MSKSRDEYENFLSGYWSGLARAISETTPEDMMAALDAASQALPTPMYIFLLDCLHAARINGALRPDDPPQQFCRGPLLEDGGHEP